MKPEFFSDQKLHAILLRNVRQERVLLTEILHLLREVERRRLFSDYKCSSTFDYTVRVLGYSEPQAGRRIQAMRLMRDVPEVEKKLTSGELSLTTAAQVQQFINKEDRAAIAKNPGRRRSDIRLPLAKKTELVDKISGLSSRNAEKVLLGEATDLHIHKESIRNITVTSAIGNESESEGLSEGGNVDVSGDEREGRFRSENRNEGGGSNGRGT